MPSASKAAATRSGGSAPLLKGSDLTNREASITVFVIGAREAPDEWQSSLILDIEETHGKGAIALNKTNVGHLSEMIDDDYSRWPGYEVTFAKTKTRNPKTGLIGAGLEVESAKKSKRKLSKNGLPF